MTNLQKTLIRFAVALLMLLAVMVVCAFIGSERLSPLRIFTPDTVDNDIFFGLRLPRIFLAALVGAALACAGAVFQALLRNPLADPYILGISSGAGLGSILAVLLGLTGTFLGLSWMAVFSFACGLGTVWLVWRIGRFTGRTSGTGLLLAGVVVNAFFSAVIMFLTSIARAADLQATVYWLMGYLTSSTDARVLGFSFAAVLLGIAVLIAISPRLNVLSISEVDARSMGISPERTFHIAFTAAALITAVAVTLGGLIGFVGLIVPHTVRLMSGPDHRRLIPFCGLAGAAFLVIADTIARSAMPTEQFPVGVITAIAGGPFFLALLIRSSRSISGGRR